jgi:hypothetical protein
LQLPITCSNWWNQSHVKVKALKANIPSNPISTQIYRWRVKWSHWGETI